MLEEALGLGGIEVRPEAGVQKGPPEYEFPVYLPLSGFKGGRHNLLCPSRVEPRLKSRL